MVFLVGDAKMIFGIEIERCVAGAGILGIIVSEFRHKKKLCPIILLEVDEGSEVSFYCTILPLSLAVRLRVKGGGEFPLDAKEIA